ncbi:MAG: response regulator [Thermoproteota archaeon]|nr:response regulator [Thermoproteota archaeon]
MKVLIAEDDSDIALTYKKGLNVKNYDVTITSNGEDCLKIYNEELHKITFDRSSNQSCYYSLANTPPFDIVLLDYLMPHINGLDVAKEILSINPHQRIIFASAYVKDTLEESIKCLKHDVELIQKPFTLNELINVLEDDKLYAELQKLNVDTEIIKAVSPTHEQIMDLLEKVRHTQKTSSF